MNGELVLITLDINPGNGNVNGNIKEEKPNLNGNRK
jgi:hypothetical protein